MYILASGHEAFYMTETTKRDRELKTDILQALTVRAYLGEGTQGDLNRAIRVRHYRSRTSGGRSGYFI